MIENGGPWRRAVWPTLKWSVITGLGLGFIAGTLSMLSGNTISVNGLALAGWYGVWTLTLSLGFGGLMFGIICALVLRALALAARR